MHNTGPLGCLPQKLATFDKKASGDFDQRGCLQPLNEAAMEYNEQLHILCEELRSELKNSTIVYVDIYSIKYDLIANAASYGMISLTFSLLPISILIFQEVLSCKFSP